MSFSSSSEQTNLLNPKETCFPQTKESYRYIPWIEPDAARETLGQHAGNLLLDLHTYMEHYTGEQKPSILTMPGLIVDKNMIRNFHPDSISQFIHFLNL